MRSIRYWGLYAFIALLMVLNYWDVVRDLAHDWWTDADASQGLILVPLAAYVAWAQRKKIVLLGAMRPFVREGLLVLAAGCALLLAGRLAAEFFLMRASFVISGASLLLLYGGYRGLQAMGLPLVLIFASIPPPALISNALSMHLRLLSSRLAADLAQAAGISLFQDGNIIHLANLSLGIAEACSGMESLTALLAASFVLAFIYLRTPFLRLGLIVSAVPIAIGVNVTRIAGTAVLADHQEKFALGFYHSFTGWLVFVIGFAALWLLSQTLRRVGA